jgi:hypothetical protein
MWNRKKTLIFALCLVSSPVFALTDPCSTLADLTSKSNPNSFVGFGAAETQKAADENAQIDMASRIRQKVTASSTVTENNDSAKLEATSKSVVSESLIGVKVLRRCSNEGSFSTVMSLDKALFVSSLEKKLSFNAAKAKKLTDTLNSEQTDEVIAKNVDSAKKFVADYQSTFESDLELCKTYSGCASIKDEHVFSSLAEAVAKQGDKDQYVMITNNDKIAEDFRDELIDLVEKDGIKVMDNSVKLMDLAESDRIDSKVKRKDLKTKRSVNRKIIAKCKATLGSKIPDSTDRVVEVSCTLESYIGKQKGFRKVYSCKAMADADISKNDAINSCSGRLQ